MTYERKKLGELVVLRDYVLATDDAGKPCSSLRSSVMLIERYLDLLTLKDDKLGAGRLITIMDESVLNTLTAREFREFIMSKFIIKAVIALPRNSFVKAQRISQNLSLISAE
jgi:hypothetical protein